MRNLCVVLRRHYYLPEFTGNGIRATEQPFASGVDAQLRFRTEAEDVWLSNCFESPKCTFPLKPVRGPQDRVHTETVGR